MEGILFDNFRILLDPRSVGVGGSWQGAQVNGCPTAWNRDTIRFFFEQASKFANPRVLDIGANTGTYCLLAKAHPNLRAFAFEPNPAIFPILCANLELNGLASRVTAVQAALGEQAGKAVLKVPPGAQSGLATLGNPVRFSEWTTATVQVIRLDEFAATHLGDGVDLVKIDTEGCELPILAGGRQLLDKHRPDVLCEFYADNTKQFGYDPRQILQFMASLGYVWARLSEEDMFFRHRSRLSTAEQATMTD